MEVVMLLGRCHRLLGAGWANRIGYSRVLLGRSASNSLLGSVRQLHYTTARLPRDPVLSKLVVVPKRVVPQLFLVSRRFVETVVTKRAAKSLRSTTWSDLRAIFALAYPHRYRLALGLSLLLVSSTIFLLTPRTLGKLIDEHVEEEGEAKNKKEDLTAVMARYFKQHPWALGGLLLVGAMAICARAYCMHTAGQLIVNELRSSVYSSLLRQDMAFFDRHKVGEMVSRLSTDALIVGYSVSMNLSDGARAALTILGSSALMVYTSPALCKVMVLVIPLVVGTFAVFGRLQRIYTMRIQDAVAQSNALATERLTAVKTVRMLVAEQKEIELYGQRMNDVWEVAKKEGLAKGAMYGAFSFTGYAAFSTVLYYGSTLIAQGQLTYGDLSSFGLYAALCASALSNLSGFFTELMKGLGAASRLFELVQTPPTIPLTGGIRLPDLAHSVRFDRVSFQYPTRDGTTPLFDQLDFLIPAHKVTAIVGPSGSGKSTIAALLLRLYDPTSGRITIDGHDLKTLDPSEWRRLVGTVGQEPVLFSTTIAENVRYGARKAEDVSDARLNEVAEQANAIDFVHSFPQGFETMVGEGGGMLSGGQKQRIAIARALANSPRLLILDEATSALDATSEWLVRNALNRLLVDRLHTTVLIIAHRLSTIKHADQIVVLTSSTSSDAGSSGSRVAECGTFDELMAKPDGEFRRLVHRQTIGETDDDAVECTAEEDGVAK